MEIPLGSGAKELGLRPSIFAVVGSVFGVRNPVLTKLGAFPLDANGVPTALFRDILSSTGGRQCQDATTGAMTAIPTDGLRNGHQPLRRLQSAVRRSFSAGYVEAAPVGWFWRQLELAVRSVQD